MKKEKKSINKYRLNNIRCKNLIAVKKTIKDIITQIDLFCEYYKKLKVDIDSKNNIKSLFDIYKSLASITETYQ